jgi:hypothetical protein
MNTETTPILTLPEPSEAEIQKVAYRLWLEGGCLQGVERDNWFAAKELLRHHHGRAPQRAKTHAEAPAPAVTSTVAPAGR